MGRYYDGDIHGKFWFGIQSSDAADRFGVSGVEPNYLEYWFQQEHLEQVQEELKRIEKGLGKRFEMLQEWYNNGVAGTTDKDFMEYLNIKDDNEMRKVLSEWADYLLGKQIEQCIFDKGDCSFTAEL